MGVGGRLDNRLARIRVCFFYDDLDLAKEQIEKAEIELAKGAEWERRNKLKVYEGHYFLLSRNFTGAANLLLDCVATFTCYELCSYQDFIFRT